MEPARWRRDASNSLHRILIFSFLLLSPTLLIPSSNVVVVVEARPNPPFESNDDIVAHFTAEVVEDALHRGHERQLLGERKQKQGLEVELVHRHHSSVSGAGGERKFKDHGEYFADRILSDMHRQLRQKQQLRAMLSQHFPNLAATDQNAGTYQFVSPVVSGSGLGSGQYFIDFYVGTPPQKFSLIADTGSDVIWLQCTPCISCYSQIGPLFNPKDSSTYNALTCTSAECQFVPPPSNATCDPKNPGVCDYAYGYSDGSETIGNFATETATMNVSKSGKTVKIDNVAFGCGLENSGPSLTAAGGIIGLGQGPLSFPSQIGSYFGNQFSYCLVNYLDAPTISSTLVFGNAGYKSKQQIQSTPFITNQFVPSLYYVGIQCVLVGGNRLPILSQLFQIDALGVGGSIVDSGTTLTVFLQPAYLIILNAFMSQITCYPRVPPEQGLDFCFDTSSAGTGDKISHLPSLSIAFDSGAVFNPPNENIYVPVGSAGNTYCLAMAGSVGPFGYNVLGNLIQQNFEITYDRQSQLFSFAPAQCSSN
ncbi:unnamed protein product [Calypogeia fissa]